MFKLSTELGMVRAVLFGFYGKACATEKSDVELLVDSGLRGLRFVGLSEELRSALRMDIDVFDVSHIESQSPIEREIRETGVTFIVSTSEGIVWLGRKTRKQPLIRRILTPLRSLS